MGNTRWLDRSQPQTLYYGNVLLYFNAAWWLLSVLFAGSALVALFALWALFSGLGVANEKRAGYWAAVALGIVNMLFLLYVLFVGGVASFGLLFNLIFGGALVALLLHPMSRNYQKIWFKKLNRR